MSPIRTGMRNLARVSSHHEREPMLFDDFRLADIRTPRRLDEMKPMPSVYHDNQREARYWFKLMLLCVVLAVAVLYGR
jgi:hypothetical protein